MRSPAAVLWRSTLALTLAGLLCSSLLHAETPRVERRQMMKRERAPQLPPKFHAEPGQPVHFPRALLPVLLFNEWEIDEPEEMTAPFPRDEELAPESRRETIGPNQLINDPTADPPRTCQSENTIAAHGRYLVAGWNDEYDPAELKSYSGYGYSSDGGATWKDGGTLPRSYPADFFGDPCLTVDDDGNFYFASLYTPDQRRLGVSVSRGRFRETSFGFDPPVLVVASQSDVIDKEWIAADPENGFLYVTYTRFLEAGGTQIELARSTDHGRTWTAPMPVTNPALEACQGSRAAVGPDHEVYVVYAAIDLGDTTAHMRIRKSKDLGRTFGREVNVGERNREQTLFVNQVCGPPGYSRAGGVALPSIAVDRSHGRDRGTVYVTWPEALNFFDDPLGEAGLQYETSDNNTPRTATPFVPGVTLAGSVTLATIPDWYSFTGEAGTTVEFFLTPYEGVPAECFLRLYCRNGEVRDRLALSYFGGGQAFILFTLPATGTYYLRVLSVDPTGPAGRYFIFTGTHLPGSPGVARDARDIMFAKSRNGIHWSARQRVNQDAERFDNSFPEVAVDGQGDVHLLWYDHRGDPACGILTDAYHSRSRDGARRFERDARVNDGPSVNWNLVETGFSPNMGDYIGLTSDGRNTYANWADGRLGTPDCWMAAITRGRPHFVELESDGGEVPPLPAPESPSDRIALSVQSPVIGTEPVQLSFAIPRSGPTRLEIYSVGGERLRTLLDGQVRAGAQRAAWDTRGPDGRPVAPGVYFVVLRNGDQWMSRRVVLLR